MRNTGERYLPAQDAARISYEHWHRYLFAARYVAGKAVLDVASGEGYGADFLARTAASVVGVDLSAEAVEHTRACYPRANLRFLEGPAEAVPVAGDHQFDVVTSFETIEHLTPDGQARFLGEARRLLRPGGLLLVSTPNRLLYTDRDGINNPFHLHDFAPDEFAAFLREAFPAVRLLAQQVYPGSYLWDADADDSDEAGGFAEHQLGLRDGGYRPLDADAKEPLYLIAVCSDEPVPPPGRSLLLDADAPGGEARDAGHVSTLFFDTGEGFRGDDCVSVRLGPAGPFRLEFDLGGRAVRGLRWDPLEGRACRVHLDSAAVDGRPLDVSALATNGQADGAGGWAFDTPDPMLFLPADGPVGTVELVGRYDADGPAESAARAANALARLHDSEHALAERVKAYKVREAELTAHATELAAGIADRDGRLADLNDEVGRRDARAAELAEAVAARDAQLAELGAEVAARHEQVNELGGQVAERDARVAARDAHIAELTNGVFARDARLAELAGVVTDRDARLADTAATLQARESRLAELVEAQRRGQYGPLVSTLFFDAGAGYRAEDCVGVQLPPAGPFRLVFDLGGRAVRGLRWDPLELRTCRVRLAEATWADADGATHPLDVATLGGNGVPDGAGGWAFDTPDPMLFLPVGGVVGRVTLAGWYETDDPHATAARTAAALADAQARADAQAAALAARDDLLRAADDRVLALAEQVRTLTVAQETARTRRQTSVLQIDTGAGFRPDDSRSQTLPDAPGPFRLTFVVSAAGVRSLRWNPGRRGGPSPRIDAVEWTDLGGQTHHLPAGAMGVGPDGPAVTLPISGGVGRVTVAGWCDAGDADRA